MAEEKKALFVIFGGTGDLARRKLYPSLYRLYKKGYLKEHFAVIGTARREWTDDYYQEIVRDAIRDIQASEEDAEKFASHFRYQSHNVKHTEHYDTLKELSDELDAEYQLEGNRIFYLAMSPSFFGLIAEHLKSQKLMTENGFNRLIIEKPFGENYATAKELNAHIRNSFAEDQMYRIDHYLGKEMVQSILPVRFTNSFLRNIWSHEFIDNIQITLSEELGVEERGGYYDHTGALKDMVQNHVLQLVALLAMEPPAAGTSEEIRKEKVAALNALKIWTPDQVNQYFVRGQYGPSASKELLGYREEENVEPESETETFVAGELRIETERWKDVPFYIRTGKRMPSKTARVDIVMKQEETMSFEPSQSMEPVVLTLHLDPGKGWSLQWNNKEIGPGMTMQTEHLQHILSDQEQQQIPEAYEKLLLDSLQGDATHFTHWEEVAASWKFIDAIRNAWDSETPDFPNYESGSLGPAQSGELLNQSNRKWIWQPDR